MTILELVPYALYALALGLINHIRGGYLNKLWNAVVFWKLFAAAAVAVLSWAMLPLGIYGLALGGLWYAFMLPPWATWFDMGQLPVEFRKQQNNYLLNWPYAWVEKHVSNATLQDVVMMSLRGWWSIVIFTPLAWYREDWRIASLAIPCGVLWMLGYWVDRNYIKLNWSEYISGTVIGVFITIACMI